jgi:hypothetical protein
VASALYDPGANVDVATGITYPTAIRQTVTLTFDHALPAGSYQIALSPKITADPYNEEEPVLLAASEIVHFIVHIAANGQVVPGASVTARGLVSASADGAWLGVILRRSAS